MYCMRHPKLWHIQHSIFSDIYRHIQSYSVLRHISAYPDIIKTFRLILANSAPCVTLAYSQPCHILNLGIFRTGSLFKTLSNVDQAYSEPCHRALFSHIQAQNLVQRLHMQKPGIFGILKYSELYHYCIPTHIQNAVTHIYENLLIFGTLTCLKSVT